MDEAARDVRQDVLVADHVCSTVRARGLWIEHTNIIFGSRRASDHICAPWRRFGQETACDAQRSLLLRTTSRNATDAGVGVLPLVCLVRDTRLHICRHVRF